MALLFVILMAIALIVLPIYLVYLFFVIHFNYWTKRGVLGPKPRPFLGNTPNLILHQRNYNEDFNEIYFDFKGKDRFVGMFNIRKPQLLVIDPKLLQEILIGKFKSFRDNEISEWFGKDVDPIHARNPFLLAGDEWKEKRAEITPALTSNRIKACYPIMLSAGEKMRKYLEAQTMSPPEDGFDAKRLCSKFSIEVVSNCIFGIEAGAFDSEHCTIRDMGASVLDQSTFTLVHMMLVSCLPKFMRRFFQKPYLKKHVQDYFIHLLEEAIKIRKETKSDRIDFLNYLLQLQEKKNLKHIELTAHTVTFLLDSFELTSLLMSNCLRSLAIHKDAQEKLRDEINKATEEDGELSYEKLLELPFLDQCINETLRLYPPATSNNKVVTETCELLNIKEKKIKIEKGTIVVIPYHAFHHDPEYFPNPEEFVPERFSPEKGGAKKYRDMGVFLPFGDGPRICIGMRFALCISKAAIVEFIRNWKITLNAKTKPSFKLDPYYFMSAPEGGNWIELTRINN